MRLPALGYPETATDKGLKSGALGLVSSIVVGIASDLWMKGVLPFVGGLLLLGALLDASYNYAQPDYGKTTIVGIGGVFVIGIGALVLGAVLMVIYPLVAPGLFQGQNLQRRGAHDLILAGMATEPARSARAWECQGPDYPTS